MKNIFKKSKEPFSFIKNILCTLKFPFMVKVIFRTINSDKEFLFLRVPYAACYTSDKTPTFIDKTPGYPF